MTRVPEGQLGTRSPDAALRDRLSLLRLPTWRFGAAGHEVSGPAESGALGTLLRSTAVDELIHRAVRAWLASDEPPAAVHAAPGVWIIPVEERRRRRRLGLTAAAAFGPDVLSSELVEHACRSAHLTPADARAALRPVAVYDASAVARLERVTAWMHADLHERGSAERSVETLSRQLTESYEEISLLYRLREYMNELAHPQRFVRQACFELLQVLPFGWAAAVFDPNRPRSRSLGGKAIASGTLPLERDMFLAAALPFLADLEPGRTRVIEGADRSALAAGASQLVVHPVAIDGEVLGAFLLSEKRGVDRAVTNIELKMIEAAAGYVAILLENSALYDEQQDMFLGTLEALTSAIDAKDPYTRGHSERVAHLAAELAREIGLSEHDVERIRIAGLVHDIGKIGVPESVLRKPGRLTDDEFDLMKKHPEIGHHILRDIPLLDDVLPGVMHHHERWDGRGYPARLAGEDIPRMARIIGLADAFEAMSSNRTYRRALPRGKVLAEIAECAGSQFDPELADAFLRVDLREYDRLVARHSTTLGDEPGQIRGEAA